MPSAMRRPREISSLKYRYARRRSGGEVKAARAMPLIDIIRLGGRGDTGNHCGDK